MVTLDLTSSVDGVNLEDGTLQDYTVILGNEEGRNILQKELEKRGVPFTCGRIPGFLS